MQGQRSICTDVYVSIDFNEEISSFFLIEKEKDIIVEMKEIFRDQSKVVYHSTPFFICQPDYYGFAFKIDIGSGNSFYLSLESDINYHHVSDHYPQCAPAVKEITTQSILGYLTFTPKPQTWSRTLYSFFTAEQRTVQSAIELHFCEQDKV